MMSQNVRQCIGGLECIQFFENITKLIPEEKKTAKFCGYLNFRVFEHNLM